MGTLCYTALWKALDFLQVDINLLYGIFEFQRVTCLVGLGQKSGYIQARLLVQTNKPDVQYQQYWLCQLCCWEQLLFDCPFAKTNLAL